METEMLFKKKKNTETTQESDEPRSTQIYVGGESTNEKQVYSYVVESNDTTFIKSKSVDITEELYKVAVDNLSTLYPDAIINTGIEHEYIRLAEITAKYLCGLSLTMEDKLLVIRYEALEGILEPLVYMCQTDVENLRADY